MYIYYQTVKSKIQIDRLMPDPCLKYVNKSHRNQQLIPSMNPNFLKFLHAAYEMESQIKKT